MRTLVVFHLGGVGGPQRSLASVTGWLREQGEVEFIVPEAGATQAQYGEVGRVTVLPYSALTHAGGLAQGARLARRLVTDVRMFRRQLRRRRLDLVIAVTTVLPAVVVAARLERIPTVVYGAELYERRRWGSFLAIGTAMLADGLVCTSEPVARRFPRWSRTPLLIAYPPIGTEYANGSRGASRALYGVEGADPCIAVIGSISRGRGQDVALHALSLVRERHPHARLLIVGAPHPRPVDLAFADELRLLTARLRLETGVLFVKPTDSMADVYAAADIVINPGRIAESFGRVAPEALMAGTPVVATRVGAVPDVIRDGVDGLLVKPDDPRALATAVGRLLDDPALARRLAETGRRHVIDRFGVDQDLAAWRQVIESVLGPRTTFRPVERPA